MKITKILLLSSAVLMAVACNDSNTEELTTTPTPTPGKDVNFGGNLSASDVTRTIYGDEVKGDGGAYSFPILWLKGDKVFIASPQCRENFREGTFAVPDDANNRDYAGSFNKEDGAVQWGNSSSADFYSIYPQRDGNYKVTTAPDFSASNASFVLNMPESQTCVVSATSASPVMKTADMNACFMYAKNAGVLNGTSSVNFGFNPLSTAIRFTLRGSDVQGQTIFVTRIRLIGPSGAALSGKFKVNLNGNSPVVTPVPNETSNIVTIYARYDNEAYLQLSYNESIELNAFIMPVSGLKIDGNWKLEVALSTGKVVTKTLTPSSSSSNTNIVAGKIHRLGNMPPLPEVDMDPAKWMEFIPRNIYLSEVSIPGSWNSLNKDFQTLASGSGTAAISKQTIANQYAQGCRLFHLDTRFRRINWVSTNFTNLGIANGGESAKVALSDDGNEKVMKEDACPLFSEALGYITSNVKSSEYMVVVCTFAQNSYVGADWKQKVSDACASNSAVYDARKITANTTVGDVLGKVIVIVASEDDVTNQYSGSKCLFVKLPNTRTSSMYPTTAGYFDTQTLYYGGKTTSGITLNCTQAQISSNTTSAIQTSSRGYAPTIAQRQTVGGNILTWAKNNHKSSHSCWMYQGLGGYKVNNTSAGVADNGYAAVTNEMGTWMHGKIAEMSATGTTPYYPVGLVLMNHVNSNNTSKQVITDMLSLNNKFHKQYDHNLPDWPNGLTYSTTTSAPSSPK